jgi:3-hydroxyacyl-[acyl-carrier-protein] dehydratase
MRFTLVDRILDWEPGKSLRAVKRLTLAEEYLADHFPTFPVMPGVLMLEALVEAGAWLWRVTTDFRHSVIVLREVKNVKYGTFMEPGRTLELTVDLVRSEEGRATFLGRGIVEGGGQSVNAQLVLAAYNIQDRSPGGKAIDDRLTRHWRERFVLLTTEIPEAGISGPLAPDGKHGNS